MFTATLIIAGAVRDEKAKAQTHKTVHTLLRDALWIPKAIQGTCTGDWGRPLSKCYSQQVLSHQLPYAQVILDGNFVHALKETRCAHSSDHLQGELCLRSI